MSLLGPSWLTLAGSVALAFAAGGVGGFFKGAGHEKDVQRIEIARQTQAALLAERAGARMAFRLQEVRDADSTRINDRLTDALMRLRNRPERLPGAALATCQGATGRELSRFDAEAFERLAARADQFRSALAQCEAWVDQVRKP